MDGDGRQRQRMLGSVGGIGGLVLLAGFLPIFPWDSPLVLVRLILFNVGAIALVFAVQHRQAHVSRGLSLATAAPAIGANAWYLAMIVLSIGRPQFPEPDPDFRPILFYAAIALWLTVAAFGFVAARLGAVSRWAAVAVGIGSLLALTGVGGLGFTTGPFAAVIERMSLGGIALLGLGMVLLGIDIALGRSEVPAWPRSAA